ncbi:MAG: hypothetical protein FWG30_03510 [Eubacteriaceae bacterium]|nr:hypothetical protein [Eubacteriaceae bacterium]
MDKNRRRWSSVAGESEALAFELLPYMEMAQIEAEKMQGMSDAQKALHLISLKKGLPPDQQEKFERAVALIDSMLE